MQRDDMAGDSIRRRASGTDERRVTAGTGAEREDRRAGGVVGEDMAAEPMRV